MVNLIRRDDREVTRSRGSEYADPFRVMDALLRWEPFVGSTWARRELFTPRFDVKENKDGYVFRADLPGVKEDAIEISVTGNVLTISGHREEERQEEGEQLYVTERSYGQFSRSFSLPDGTDTETIKADLKNGVLTVQVGKKPEVKPRKIEISVSGTKS